MEYIYRVRASLSNKRYLQKSSKFEVVEHDNHYSFVSDENDAKVPKANINKVFSNTHNFIKDQSPLISFYVWVDKEQNITNAQQMIRQSILNRVTELTIGLESLINGLNT